MYVYIYICIYLYIYLGKPECGVDDGRRAGGGQDTLQGTRYTPIDIDIDIDIYTYFRFYD